jgi:hypothetical protein
MTILPTMQRTEREYASVAADVGTRQMKQKWMLFAVATALAIWLSWVWGLAFLHWPISVLSGGDEPQVSIVRRVMPHHLVKPEWVTPMPDGELTAPWLIAETKVRMSIIGVGWLGCVVGVWTRKKRRANHTSDGIRQPADGSPKPSR